MQLPLFQLCVYFAHSFPPIKLFKKTKPHIVVPIVSIYRTVASVSRHVSYPQILASTHHYYSQNVSVCSEEVSVLFESLMRHAVTLAECSLNEAEL